MVLFLIFGYLYVPNQPLSVPKCWRYVGAISQQMLDANVTGNPTSLPRLRNEWGRFVGGGASHSRIGCILQC
jgi:hypothetical protein